MKSNFLIIAGVTLAALGVIAVVIIASVISQSEPQGSRSEYSVSQGEPAGDSAGESSADASAAVVSKPSSGYSSGEAANNIATMANTLIGTPFVENGASPEGFDNSGFIYYVLKECGFVTCPRGTEAQSRMGTPLGYDEVKRGDLVFFSDDGEGGALFGGIYVGGGKMTACLMPGTFVKEVDITSDYYRKNFVTGVGIS